MRWKLGVWIGPPKGLVAPKPTSSVRISRTLGALFGAATAFGKSGTEPLTVRSILPLNAGSGRGRTSCAIAGHANATTTTAQRSQWEIVLARSLMVHSLVSRGVAGSLELSQASF